MLSTDPRALTRPVLWLDAASCALMGVGLVAAAGFVAAFTGLPSGLLRGAGLALLPVAAFIAAAAGRAVVPRWMLAAIVWGNVGWVLASLLVLTPGLLAPNALGVTLVGAQALAVALLTALEWRGLAGASTARA